jgi:hypothetical protein
MTTLFAQFQPNNNANAGPPPEFWAIFIVILLVILAVGLVIAIFFLLTLSKALSRCRARNRTMEPGQVWLNLIPIFNIVWMFITVNRIAESLSNEFYDRGWDRGGEDYGKSIGTTYCIMNLLGWIPYCGSLFGLIGLVCFIIYWVKIAGFSRELATGGSGGYGDYDDRDDRYDEDDRPRRKRRDDRDEDDDRDDRDDEDDDRGRGRGGSKPWERGRR